MNWTYWRRIPWVDSRAKFVARTRVGGRLLDLGTSDGSTLRHFAELRPDISFAAVDLNRPGLLPEGAEFATVDLETGPLPWPDEEFDSITCMHLIEHLRGSRALWSECARVLKRGGQLYVETPGPLSLTAKTITGPAAGSVTMNFYDDPTHTSLVPVAQMESDARDSGLQVSEKGKSRNWIFVMLYPLLALLRPNTRGRYVAKLHWMGWSHFVVALKGAGR
ncbi:MAG: class I SAM-dependent methyltransferase [Gemmatimonadaceae bacterium]|nr:class I SAM-dependent methyltransferase [Gemmatimonadaceae bacterium]